MESRVPQNRKLYKNSLDLHWSPRYLTAHIYEQTIETGERIIRQKQVKPSLEFIQGKEEFVYPPAGGGLSPPHTQRIMCRTRNGIVSLVGLKKP